MLSSADQGQGQIAHERAVGGRGPSGHNLEKLSDAAECFAVEGMVTGELGRQHWAFGLAVGELPGRARVGRGQESSRRSAH